MDMANIKNWSKDKVWRINRKRDIEDLNRRNCNERKMKIDMRILSTQINHHWIRGMKRKHEEIKFEI